MNVELMERIAKKLDSLPDEKFNMGNWGRRIGSIDDPAVVCPETANECGTSCCIGGWALVDKGYCVSPGGNVYSSVDEQGWGINYLGEAEEMAAKLLDLDHDEAQRLFFEGGWPVQFQGPLAQTASPKQGAARIRHMIVTGE